LSIAAMARCALQNKDIPVSEIIPLFPIPLLRAPAVLPPSLVDGLVRHFSSLAVESNKSSDNLVHTKVLRPSDSPLFVEVAQLITPGIVEFGTVLFGETMGWSMKEMWVNVLSHGGKQAMHNHANSFISGVVYLTPTHPSAQTVFIKSPGGSDFQFRNDHSGVALNEFNADKWISPAPNPGDMILFPSYLMHAVPPNQGETRISLAFNAIPARFDSWGYVVKFSG